MTGNQVSYASVKVSQQMADETERHNRQTEEETNRHNTEVEAVNRMMAEIDQQKVNLNYEIESTKNSLTREYNQIMKDYYAATTEEKQWYDTQLAYIESMKANADQRYKEGMVTIGQQQNVLNERKVAEEKRHNEAVENLNAQANQIAQYGKDIEARRVDYQARQWETENWLNFERYGLQYQELGLKQLQEQHSYELGLMNMEAVGAQNLLRSEELDIKREQLSLEQQMLNYKQDLIKSQTITNYWNSANQTLFHKSNLSFSDILKGVTILAPALVP